MLWNMFAGRVDVLQTAIYVVWSSTVITVTIRLNVPPAKSYVVYLDNAVMNVKVK